MANRKISALDPVTIPASGNVFPVVNEDVTRKMDLRQLQDFMATACRLAATGNIDLTTGGLVDIDGMTTVAGNRILVWQQTNAAENGIYTVADGSWTRAENFNAPQNMVRGTLIPILEGNTHAGAIFQHSTTENITVETTNISFAPAAVPSWGVVQGDINAQTDLVNRIESDITTAVDNLREGVPTDGDTLNKLYNLIQGVVGVSASAVNIDDRDAQMADLEDQQNIYVEDAAADPTINSGWAIYKYMQSTTSFIKIAEEESLDVNFNWGALQGDINAQADLVNRIESDITAAMDSLREGVPANGDTLNKLYNLIQGAVGVSASATDIADRDAQMASLQDQQNIHVADALADPTVNSGWAIYKYIQATTSFVKIAEEESLDVNFNWGALQGDINAQADLVNRIESDITAAMGSLREGVPTDGDTLNKLYGMTNQIARQELSPAVAAPSASEDGYIISWDEANSRYDLVRNEGTTLGRYAAVYYVDPVLGNDATAAANTTALPYLSINAAANAAYERVQSSGIPTLVYIKFGTYEAHSITRNGVDIYAEDGVLVYTAQEGVAVISDQSDSYFGSGNRFNVYGKGAYFNLNVKPFNDSVGVNIRRQTNCYIEANAIGDVQIWLDLAETNVHIANAVVHFWNDIVGGDNKLVTFTNCTLYTPVKIDGGGTSVITCLYDRCTFILLPDYSYMGDTRLWQIEDRFNATTIDITDPAVAGSNAMNHYQTGFTANDELLANYTSHDFRLSYTCIVEGHLQALQSKEYTFMNCEFVIEREFCNGIMILQDSETASGKLTFSNVIIRDETPSGDTTAMIMGQLPAVTDPLDIVLGSMTTNAGSTRKSFPGYDDITIAYHAVNAEASWGTLQGDINTQADLVNRIEGDISTAVDNLREGVPTDGDTLNKLYNLQESLSEALGDKADNITNVYDMTIIVGPEEEETSPANASLSVRAWMDANPGLSGRIVILPGVYEENEINQHEVDIWAVDGAIVWSAQPARSILSDRHTGGNTVLRVYGKGIFVHAAPNGSNDQQGINFRYSGADVYVQAKTIDMPQMWHNGFQKLTVEDCEFLFRDPGSNRSNFIIELNNCRFPNGLRPSGYNNGFSTLKIRNSEIIMSRKMGMEGMEIRDKQGNLALTVDHSWMHTHHQNNTQQLMGFSGASGEGNIIVEGMDYPISFHTDLETTIENMIGAHEAALQDTADSIRLYRAVSGSVSGTSGEGTLGVDGVNFSISFDTDTAATARQFVISEASALAGISVVCKAIENQLVFTRTDGLRPAVEFANVSGDLDVGINNDYLLAESDEKVEFALSFSNTGGDLAVQVTDYYSLEDLAHQLLSTNSYRHGYVGIHKNHFFIAGGDDGRGQNIWLDNVLIRLQKRKTIGIKMVPRENELTGRHGGLYVDGLYIRDETGTGETIAVVQGYDSAAVTHPFTASINGLIHNCGQGMVRIEGLDDMTITSSDPAYRTGDDIQQELRPETFNVPFTQNLTQSEILLLNGAPNALTENLIGVAGITYRISPNNDDWSVMADINDVTAYAQSLTPEDTYFLEISVADVAANVGFVRITQS